MYGDNEIRLIFVLSSVDANSHIEILAKLMELFEDEKLINDLLNANTKEQLLQILGGKIWKLWQFVDQTSSSFMLGNECKKSSKKIRQTMWSWTLWSSFCYKWQCRFICYG